VGYDYVDQALNGHMALKLLIALCLVKMVATIVSYSSGNAGGIFAPTLFLGAMAGGAVGTVVHRLALFPTATPGAYALVGMGTLFAGIIRAPMTSVFMVFEITQDYQILVPLMVANLLSFVISRHFQETPVYHALLHQDGVHLPTTEGAGNDDAWTVRDVMSTDVPWLRADQTVKHAVEHLTAHGLEQAVVLSNNRLTGIVRLPDAEALAESGQGSSQVEAIARPVRAHVHPDHRMDVLFERWRSADGLLPVVARTDVSRVEGVIRLEEIRRFLDSPDLGELTIESATAAKTLH
jgi:CIC family chloride channel protein